MTRELKAKYTRKRPMPKGGDVRIASTASGSDPEIRANLNAWETLQSKDYVVHLFGRTFLRNGCAMCRGQQRIYDREAWVICPSCEGHTYTARELAPVDHPNGACFTCSGYPELAQYNPRPAEPPPAEFPLRGRRSA
jgi:hypothetical protein